MRYFVHEINEGAGVRKLRAYLPDATKRSYYHGKRPAVVIFPGGGYGSTYEGEAEPIALDFAAAGICAFVLDYSTRSISEKVWPYAQLEAFAAIRYVRENAQEFGIQADNIASLGFSAGGHLCACTGTLWNKPVFETELGDKAESSRPDKLILCYPVIRAIPPYNKGSFVNLLGGLDKLTPDMQELLSLEKQVDDQTPPSFIWTTAEDTGVPIQGALEFAHALVDHNTHVELHVYPHGKHGLCLGNHVTQAQPFGVNDSCESWVQDAVRFLFDEAVKKKVE